MPVSLLTWRKSATYTVAAQTVAGLIAALKAAIDAEVAANPATAKWQVASYATGTSNTLVLKARAGGTRRLMIFGGSDVPNGAAIGGANFNSPAAWLYGGVAPTAGVDSPEQAYTTGVPFTTGRWIGGASAGAVYSGMDRVTYHEHDDGILVLWHYQNMTGGDKKSCHLLLGGHGINMDDDTVVDVAAGSCGPWIADFDSNSQDTSDWAVNEGSYMQSFLPHTLAPSNGSGTSTGTSRIFYNDPTAGAKQGAQMLVPINAMGMWKSQSNRQYFLPFFVLSISEGWLRIKLRQIAIGPAAVHDTVYTNGTDRTARKLAVRGDVASEGPWLTSFAV